jgi:GDPmannose 4,6-dehydratase
VVFACSNQKYNIEIGKNVLEVDPKYFRPTEVDVLIGDPKKARKKLGWVPENNLEDLVNDMMKSDLKLFEKEKYLNDKGL